MTFARLEAPSTAMAALFGFVLSLLCSAALTDCVCSGRRPLGMAWEAERSGV